MKKVVEMTEETDAINSLGTLKLGEWLGSGIIPLISL